MQASLGPHVGHAYIAGRGKAVVFHEHGPYFVLQVQSTGERIFTHRSKITWRKI